VEGTWSFFENSSKTVIPGTYSLADPHTLNVSIGDIEKGTYTLKYQVKADKILDTANMTTEEIIAAGNGNTATWEWKGTSKQHDVVSYATSGDHVWIKKQGANGAETGAVGIDGVTSWCIYINTGSMPEKIAGVTITDTLDPGMTFMDHNIEIKRSYDMKTWISTYTLNDSNFGKDGDSEYFKFTFPSDAPAAYYRIKYNTKVIELPDKKTKYNNRAVLTLGNEVLGEDDAHNEYNHVGAFQMKIEKEKDKLRDDETGIVSWKSYFSVDGTRSSYSVKITDNIKPADETSVIAGKTVGVKMLESVKIYRVDDNNEKVGDPLTNYTVTYGEASFEINFKKLESGNYVIYYDTQDYYDKESEHTYPDGSRVHFDNEIKITIDGQSLSDDDDYDVVSDGLPMQKLAFSGYFDSTEQTFAIPWKIYVNRNELGQTNELIKTKAKSVVTDYLPDKLYYKADSAEFTRPDGTTFKLEPTQSKGDNGSTILKWEYEWERGESVSGSSNYYVLSFISYMDKDYFEELKDANGDGEIEVSFDNDVFGDVGGNKGGTNTSSYDKFQFLAKTAEFNEDTQLVEYSVRINVEGFDLIEDSDELKLKDELTNGTFVTGSLHVYYYDTQEEYPLKDGDVATSKDGRSFTITLPDKTPFVVKYAVKPDVKKGESSSGTKVDVNVSNTATLYGDGNKASEWKRKYSVDTVSADITSEVGQVKITKVDADNTFKGLEGATIGLYKVDIETGKETLVESQTTEAEDYCALFKEDGKYKSLIFDTLYFYKELVAPKGYKLDETKHYFIFVGTQYEDVKDKVAAYLGDKPVTVIDVKESGSQYDFTLENSLIPDEPPTPPTPPTPPEPQEEPPTPPDNPPSVPPISYVPPQPEVLGARRNEQAVLGARRAATEDRDMSYSYFAIFAALVGLAATLSGIYRDKKKR
jgi:hypothetical protein